MLSIVPLVSGGLDSTVMAFMFREEGITQYPLFINYGQLAAEREWRACNTSFARLKLPKPTLIDIAGFGKLIKSGLTDPSLDIVTKAFLPNRNLLFLVAAASFAWQNEASAVAIGLLCEEHHLFPDQTANFLENSQETLRNAMFYDIKILAPLIKMTKRDIIELARLRNIGGTYSCHKGHEKPCGKCISCLENMKSK